ESHTYKEISQMGLEFIGDIHEEGVVEVIDLAVQTLRRISPKYILELSHMDFVLEMLDEYKMADVDKVKMIKQIRNRNIDGIMETGRRSRLSEEQIEKICLIPTLQGNVSQVISRARKVVLNDKMAMALNTLENIYKALKIRDSSAKVKLDLSTINDIDYYNGVIFKGYIEGIGRSVLAGGQYDRAMLLFNKDVDAIGFALYLNEISRLDLEAEVKPDQYEVTDGEMLNIALPKGRLGNRVYELLAGIGYDCKDFYEENRKLVFENPGKKIRFLLVKPSDVAIYVEHNAADVGIVGKDILLETSPDVYELLDLKIGKCRMAVAARNDYVDDPDRTLRVATKFVNVTKKYYSEINRDIDIIKLNGSIELAPMLGLSDVIVDLVESGNTIKENDLQILEEFKQISARFIANKSSYKFKNEIIEDIINKLSESIREK
ncbi:MAG: ATP phosphoribosyltransferase, partial [Peptostreptococcaceae bacterium]|nr:ATP phosphoribosyltransferase [Peptostreptococcaceae bacterium]